MAGIAGSVAILISGTFWRDAIEYFMDVQFNRCSAPTCSSAFAEPVADSALRELRRLPGVKQAKRRA